jgi:hypothetical protein
MRVAAGSTQTDPEAAIDGSTSATARPAPSARPSAQTGQRRFRSTSVGVGALVALLAVTGTACSSSSTPSSTTSAATSAAASPSSASDPAGKEQICAARDELKTSVSALINPVLLTGGVEGIKTAVANVQTSLDDVKEAGKQDYAQEVDALQSSLGQLQTAVGQLGEGNGTESLRAVGTAIAATGTAAEGLLTKLNTDCG